jgi:hypothetical protein
MKLGIVIGLSTSLAFVIATSCSVNHRSDEFACTKTLDCDPGRVCSSDGFCVLGTVADAAKSDAPRPDAAPPCPSGCTSCNVTDKTCTIDCTMTTCNNTTITCPAGYKCDILCNTDSSCRSGINCRQAASCNIECSGGQSCRNVSCGPGPCDVSCSGPSSCRNVACGSSCACDVTCTGNQSCSSNIFCKSFACDTGSGCTSMRTGCNTCL